nr:pentatricopeptide repeat-containing protein [Quercus suber]
MAGWGMQPDAVTNHLFISKYCREGKVDCALMLLNNMLSCNLASNVHCYKVLINALYKENRLLEVYDLFKSVLVRGVVPDHVLSFVLMKKYPEGQRLHLAHLILQAIAKNGCGFDPSMLSSSAGVNSNGDLEQEIEILLEGIVRCNFNLANVAFGVIVSALCGDGKPNVPYFTWIKLCLCQKGLFEDAKYLLDLMQDQGVVPNQATYLIMVNEHCKGGDLVSAFHILDQMDERGLRPNVAIYDTIIGCLSREKRIFEAEEMFKRMLESGVDPDEVVYVTMINGYSKNGRAIEAHQLFGIMLENSIQPSSYSYTALISGLVDLMDRNQIDTDLIMYISLVSGVSRNISGIKKEWSVINKKSEREREMLFHLLHQRTLMPMKKILRISADTPEEMKCFALKLMQKFKDIEFMPNLYLYNGIISGFCRTEWMRDAYDHFEKMQREGVHPNEVTYTILIDGHIQSGDIDSAIELFNKMNADGFAPDRIAYNTLLKGLCKAGRLLDALSLS